ncbi:MAG: GNAT family N-acetyltransferase [Jaaginema sp. PMC 1079.18]|nr:GNAT family N-acetyltransferase [Jaaginema sp. PMC 1080.18]MEC4849408.1 GNAT family N-acetyltransferase [Jaaginema sp. PMC 1079.18]MEC4864960.1 GNAT family N-acetyltransferase [Jaaginema sp. PMC 1078.18]
MTKSVQILSTTEVEDRYVAQHFYQMWLDNGIQPAEIQENWLAEILSFIKKARRELQYQAFVAQVDNGIIGSVSCQLFSGLYPNILISNCRQYGYIWGVYVSPEYRRQGIGKQLVQQALKYLRSQGCTRAILHTSPWGKPLYTQLNFVNSNEMQLDLNSIPIIT